MLELYKKIRARREELKMSQEELAKKLGYKSRSSINKIEKGENDIPQSKIIAFANALETTPEYLMGWEGTSPSLPKLTVKDERQIANDLEDMLHSLKGAAAMGDPKSAEDAEMLRASLETAMRLSKRIAKQKYTPRKYRKDE